jgi:hypothetical protein
LQYAELTRREVQVVTLSSDTTESDLKQRRELVQNANGSVSSTICRPSTSRSSHTWSPLLLDGLERAERNVLPTLNNLLENREMNLEDGRFLISPRRQEELVRARCHHAINDDEHANDPSVQSYSSSLNLVPVHQDFQ